MNAHPEMKAAAAETARIVGNVKPAQLDDVTPCHDWNVRALLNHIILWTAYSAEQRAHGGSVAEELMSKDFAASPDFADDYAGQVGRAVTAWADPAAWQRDLGVMGSPMPSADVAAMLIMELVLHGWDLAAATGQEYRCDGALATFVLSTVEQQAEMFRQYQGFGPAKQAPDAASDFEKALALAGRGSDG